MANYNLGRFVLIPRGEYSQSTPYTPLDVVLFQGSSYVCKTACTNKVPTNTTYWQLLAEAGQPTMTEAQKDEIIAAILAEGVIVDPNYNTFTSAEKEKLATLTQPNNGELLIYHGGYMIGRFRANQSAYTEVNLPVSGNGAITLRRADNSEVLGSFTTNQSANQTIDIPVGSGGGGTATITIKQGGTTVDSFTLQDDTNKTINIPNAALTLQKNGTTIGTYAPSAAQTINLSVPTSTNDLSNANDIKLRETLVKFATQDGTNEYLKGDGYIVNLQPNHIYVTEELTSFAIRTLEFRDSNRDTYLLENFRTLVILDVYHDFVITLPDNCFVCGDTHLRADYKYLLEFYGQFCRISEYVKIENQ